MYCGFLFSFYPSRQFLLTTNSFLPESPRWLITKDRSQEAYEILIKYHGEIERGDEFVQAELAQMKTTIQLELEVSKKSWMDLVSTSGMRRRLLITTMLGLFTQWSGNTLISYVNICYPHFNNLQNWFKKKKKLTWDLGWWLAGIIWSTSWT